MVTLYFLVAEIAFHILVFAFPTQLKQHKKGKTVNMKLSSIKSKLLRWSNFHKPCLSSSCCRSRRAIADWMGPLLSSFNINSSLAKL